MERVLAVLAALLLVAPAAEAATLGQAEAAHTTLRRALRRKCSDNVELIRHLERGATAMRALEPPPRPPPTGDAVKDKRRLEAWARARDRFTEQRARLDEAWVKLLGTALTRYRPHRASLTNARSEVNLRALELLRRTLREDAAHEVMNGVEALLRETAFDVRPMLRAHLDALGVLDRPCVFDRLREAFVGPERSPWLTVLGLDALARLDAGRGARRYRLVREIVETYGEEVDKPAITAAALRAARAHSGVLHATMADLVAWFEKHARPNRKPWLD